MKSYSDTSWWQSPWTRWGIWSCLHVAYSSVDDPKPLLVAAAVDCQSICPVPSLGSENSKYSYSRVGLLELALLKSNGIDLGLKISKDFGIDNESHVAIWRILAEIATTPWIVGSRVRNTCRMSQILHDDWADTQGFIDLLLGCLDVKTWCKNSEPSYKREEI